MESNRNDDARRQRRRSRDEEEPEKKKSMQSKKRQGEMMEDSNEPDRLNQLPIELIVSTSEFLQPADFYRLYTSSNLFRKIVKGYPLLKSRLIPARSALRRRKKAEEIFLMLLEMCLQDEDVSFEKTETVKLENFRPFQELAQVDTAFRLRYGHYNPQAPITIKTRIDMMSEKVNPDDMTEDMLDLKGDDDVYLLQFTTGTSFKGIPQGLSSYDPSLPYNIHIATFPLLYARERNEIRVLRKCVDGTNTRALDFVTNMERVIDMIIILSARIYINTSRYKFPSVNGKYAKDSYNDVLQPMILSDIYDKFGPDVYILRLNFSTYFTWRDKGKKTSTNWSMDNVDDLLNQQLSDLKSLHRVKLYIRSSCDSD
jgi:hypothetical protein